MGQAGGGARRDPPPQHGMRELCVLGLTPRTRTTVALACVGFRDGLSCRSAVMRVPVHIHVRAPARVNAYRLELEREGSGVHLEHLECGSGALVRWFGV